MVRLKSSKVEEKNEKTKPIHTFLQTTIFPKASSRNDKIYAEP